MLRVSPSMTLKELQSIQDLINKWVELYNGQIPIIHFTAEPKDLELFVTQLVGELRIVAGKSDNLADVLSGAR